MTGDRYWLSYSDRSTNQQWFEVTRQDWIRAERSAGMRPKDLKATDPAYMTTLATGGFGVNRHFADFEHDGRSYKCIAGKITRQGESPP